MTGVNEKTYIPNAENHKVYQKLYVLYKQLHDAFGTQLWHGNCANIMKELLDIKYEAANGV